MSARDLLRRLLCWSINGQDAVRDLRNLREDVVLLTGRVDLGEIDSHDFGLHDKLIEAVEDYMDSLD